MQNQKQATLIRSAVKAQLGEFGLRNIELTAENAILKQKIAELEKAAEQVVELPEAEKSAEEDKEE